MEEMASNKKIDIVSNKKKEQTSTMKKEAGKSFRAYEFNDVIEASKKYFNGDELAATVWANKYALKDSKGKIYERTPDDMHRRIAREIARIEKRYPNPLNEKGLKNLPIRKFELFKVSLPTIALNLVISMSSLVFPSSTVIYSKRPDASLVPSLRLVTLRKLCPPLLNFSANSSFLTRAFHLKYGDHLHHLHLTPLRGARS